MVINKPCALPVTVWLCRYPQACERTHTHACTYAHTPPGSPVVLAPEGLVFALPHSIPHFKPWITELPLDVSSLNSVSLKPTPCNFANYMFSQHGLLLFVCRSSFLLWLEGHLFIFHIFVPASRLPNVPKEKDEKRKSWPCVRVVCQARPRHELSFRTPRIRWPRCFLSGMHSAAVLRLAKSRFMQLFSTVPSALVKPHKCSLFQ